MSAEARMFLILINIFSNSHPTPTPKIFLKCFHWPKLSFGKFPWSNFRFQTQFEPQCSYKIVLIKKECMTTPLFAEILLGCLSVTTVMTYNFLVGFSYQFSFNKNHWNIWMVRILSKKSPTTTHGKDVKKSDDGSAGRKEQKRSAKWEHEFRVESKRQGVNHSLEILGNPWKSLSEMRNLVRLSQKSFWKIRNLVR